MIKTRGIVLHTLPLKENDILFTIFSPEGMIKLYAKQGALPNKGLASLLSPLTHAEFVIKESPTEIKICQEGYCIQLHLKLRSQLPLLDAACDTLQAISKSQWPGKPAPALYDLLVYTLEKISDVNDPYAFASSFRLKILRHEGLWDFEQEEEKMMGFTSEESFQAKKLALSRSFKELQNERITLGFRAKVIRFFDELIA